jgi:DNA-binding NtrC family response regulator
VPARVVVVHDETDFSDRAVTALGFAGYDVVAFADPMAALNALDTAERVEVLITRVEFEPGKINGVALALMARTKRPGIKVVFAALQEFEHHAAGLGEFMPAPVSVSELVETVRQLLTSAG